MMAAESSVIQWVLAKQIIADGRVASFRSLGRGWLFVLLRRPERKFKVWFESVQRVLMNHEMDIKVSHAPLCHSDMTDLSHAPLVTAI